MNERIENYFNRNMPPPERDQFEKELHEDPQLAEEVAFYLRTKQVLREEILARRHTEWQQARQQKTTKVRPLRSWSYAAAAVLAIALGATWFWNITAVRTAPELAQAYVQEYLTTLPVQMGGDRDTIQLTTQYYNAKKYAQALALSTDLLQRNPDNAEALKLAGLISLQQQNYDQAIARFAYLAALPDLYANPGKFYQAIAHLQRGQPGDKKTAEALLQEVVSGNLEGKVQAEKWLSSLLDS